MRVIEVVLIAILVFIGFFLLGILGIVLSLIVAVFLGALWNLYKKYFTEPEQPKPKLPNWQCSYCGRINSPRAKICIKCGFEREWKKDD